MEDEEIYITIKKNHYDDLLKYKKTIEEGGYLVFHQVDMGMFSPISFLQVYNKNEALNKLKDHYEKKLTQVEGDLMLVNSKRTWMSKLFEKK